MDLATYSLFGDVPNTSAIPATMLNTNADGTTDWNAVMASGIRGAAQAAISASVGEKFADGQLIATGTAAVTSNKSRNLLLIAVVAWLVLR